MYRRNFLFLILVYFILISDVVFSQDMPEINQQNLMTLDLSNIRVDQLTDAQIRSYMQRIEQSGLSEEEIEAALLSRGLPQSELMLLKERINAITTGSKSAGTGFGTHPGAQALSGAGFGMGS